MPDRYMSVGVVTAGVASADSYRNPELKIPAGSVDNGGGGVISECNAKGAPWALPAATT